MKDMGLFGEKLLRNFSRVIFLVGVCAAQVSSQVCGISACTDRCW